jgi:hypothetical protein
MQRLGSFDQCSVPPPPPPTVLVHNNNNNVGISQNSNAIVPQLRSPMAAVVIAVNVIHSPSLQICPSISSRSCGMALRRVPPPPPPTVLTHDNGNNVDVRPNSDAIVPLSQSPAAAIVIAVNIIQLPSSQSCPSISSRSCGTAPRPRDDATANQGRRCHQHLREGGVGTLKDGYICRVPLPRVPRVQSTSPVTCTTIHRNTAHTDYLPIAGIPTWSNLSGSL